MYLLDTNIWLERMINGPQSNEVGQLLERFSSDELHVSEFTLHAMAMLLKRRGEDALFTRWTLDLFVDGGVKLVSLIPEEIKRILRTMDQYRLDYHDAYQYTAAEKYHLTMVSFNDAFERTQRGYKTPGKLLVL